MILRTLPSGNDDMSNVHRDRSRSDSWRMSSVGGACDIKLDIVRQQIGMRANTSGLQGTDRWNMFYDIPVDLKSSASAIVICLHMLLRQP